MSTNLSNLPMQALLASEGFTTVEELAMVDEKDVASIEGFDEETGRELQSRAQEYLAQIEAFSCGSAGWRRSFLLT